MQNRPPPQEVRVLDALVEYLAPALAATNGQRNNCIQAARMAIEVLRSFGVRAKAQPVHMCIMNPAATDKHLNDEPVPLGEPGYTMILTDVRRPLTVGDGYTAHLVVTTDSAMLDLTLDQYSKSDHDVHLEPLWVPDTRLKAGTNLCGLVNDCYVRWMPLKDKSFLMAPAWEMADEPASKELIHACSRRIMGFGC